MTEETNQFEIRFRKLNAYQVAYSVRRNDGMTISTGKFKALDEQETTEEFSSILALIEPVPDPVELRMRWLTEVDNLMNSAKPAGDTEPPQHENQQNISTKRLKSTSEDIVDQAEAYLSNERLLECIGRDLEDLGIVGDRVLKVLLVLCGISRLFVSPFSVLVQGATSSGKSYITKMVVWLFPDEAKLDFTSFSEKALFYMGENFLMNRFVVAGERPKEADRDQGGEGMRGREVLRQLLSEKQIIRYVTSEKGRRSEKHTARGPISFVETTTTTKIMAEDLNRVIAIETDDSPEQTARVLAQIAAECSGAPSDENKNRIQQVHHAIHRLMINELGTGVSVSIPFVDQIQKMFAVAKQPDARRYCNSFLAVIYAITTLYWRQRARDQYGRLIATLDDYNAARTMMDELLSAALLDSANRKEQLLIKKLAETFGDKIFTQKEAAEATELHQTTISRKLKILAAKGVVEQTMTPTGKSAGKYRILEASKTGILTEIR